MCFYQKYPTFVELANGEVYKIKTPTLSAHNLVFGSPYLDIGDRALVTRIKTSKGKKKVHYNFRLSSSEEGGLTRKRTSTGAEGRSYLMVCPKT